MLSDGDEDPREYEALGRSVITQFEQYIKLNKKIPPEVLVSLNQIEDTSKLADTVASHLALKIPEKQELLELPTITDRLERAYSLMEAEIGVLQVEKRIRSRVKRQMEKTQREYYLNEQMKAIQKELGEERTVVTKRANSRRKSTRPSFPMKPRRRRRRSSRSCVR